MVVEIAIIAAAFFCEATFGFGGGMISVPLLSLLMSVKEAVTLVLIFQLGTGLLLLRVYKDVQKNIAVSMSIGVLIGAFAGFFSLISLPENILRIILATVIFLFLLQMAAGKRLQFRLQPTVPGNLLAGLLGGLFQGLIGMGGPPLTLYLLAIGLPAKSFRATMIFLLFITSILRTALSFRQELFTPDITHTALFAFPVFLMAIVAGHYLFRRFNERYYKISVGIILLFSATLMLLKV